MGLAMNEPKVVVNLSIRNLSAAETNLLHQGLNYSFFSKKLSSLKFVPSLNVAYI